MRTSLALLALAATAFAVPQAVTEDIAPKDGPPKGCTTSYDGKFEVTIFTPGKSKRDISERSCNGEGVLVLTLKDGVLKDAKDRTGYISNSFQFQFDKPAQAGAIYTSGFSVCSNGTLAFGPSAIFWQCQSGDFYNLYDRNWAEQCEPVEFGVMPCGKSSKSAPKKRIVGSSVIATTVVTVVSDGTTKEVPTTIAVPMCQIGDGQVQVRTTPCDDMELPIITAPPVSQVSDGKLQVPTTAPPAPPPVQRKPAVPENPAVDEPAKGGGDGGDAAHKCDGSPSECGSRSGGAPGDEPKPAGGDSQPGASPAGNNAPENTGAATPGKDEKPSGDKPSNGGQGTGGKSKPTRTEEEVLATDSSSPTDTKETSSAQSKSTQAVKPFKPQSTNSNGAEETGSGSGAGSDKGSSDAAQSDAFKVVVSVGMVIVSGVLGGLLVL
ncbi:related to covalently-linked cell wall protein [Fusarium torulosum]|uniref:Related to covalently-linked cell wall protein n=1 Tax=Fusarium torulosum TaxID=33205 RepID=A0AAE8M6Q6_9HYPO|nr:related to covalently-linked cell wall protein [Fusarium torulosum]